MSGPSTLRLCFAAMAPALTEAASARLKLQNSGSKHCDSRTLQGDRSASSHTADHLSPQIIKGVIESFPSCDLEPSGDRVDPTNGTYCDTLRSQSKGKGGGLNLTSGIVPTTEKNINNSTAVNIGHLTSLSIVGKQINSFVDAGSGGEDARTNGFLEGFKRMNQPYFVSNNSDRSVEDCKNHFNSSDTLRILASKVVSQAGMVNGDNGNDNRDKDDEQQLVKNPCVLESGDARVSFKNTVVEASKDKNSEQKKGHLKFSLPLVETDKQVTGKTMGMCEKDKINLSTKLEKQFQSSLLTKKLDMEKPCEDVRKECVKKQAYLERKVEMLLRRLKRVKGRVVENHTKEQLAQYVNFQHRNLQMVAKSIKREAPCPEVLKEHFLSNEDVKNMSTSQLVKLVRDNQSSKSLPVTDNARYRLLNTSASVMSPNLQRQSLSTSERLSLRVEGIENDLDSDATASSSGGESCDEDSIYSPKDTALPSILKRAEWKWAVERAAIVSRWTWLQAQVSDLEYKIRQQSQVHRQLRNSKGGVVLGDPPTAIDILRKLQGFKPNQVTSSTSEMATTDGKNSITHSGGCSSTEVSPYNITRLLSNVDKQASRLTQSLNCISPSSSTVGSPGANKVLSPGLNHMVTDSPSSNSVGSEITDSATADNSPLITVSSSSIPNLSQQQQQSIPESLSLSSSSLSQSTSSLSDASFQAARCRPLRSYRKRKILRTIGLFKVNVKAARLSDVRCKCHPPSNPCAMCGGRYNNTLSMDAENMSFNERVALLDTSYHPVLSFPQDIPLSIYCEGFLKSGLWQNKPQSKRSKSADFRRQKAMSFAVPQSVSVKKSLSGNNNSKTSSSAPSVINFTTKIKNKYEGKSKAKKAGSISKTAPLKHKVKKKVQAKAVKLSKAMRKKKEQDQNVDDVEAMYLEQEAGCSSSTREDRLSGSGVRDSQRRRRVDNAFDINNIEIPHSIAASTRVEQIQYKEIVTPKWRVVEDDEDSSTSQTGTSPSVEENSWREPLTAASIGKVLEKSNGVSVSLEEHHGTCLATPDCGEEEAEDLSDEAYLKRHAVPEQEERKRFRNFLQYPPVRRNRARSDAFLNSTVASNTITSTNSNNNSMVTDQEEGCVQGDQQAVDLGENGDTSVLNSSIPVVNESCDQKRQSMLASEPKRERAMSAGPSDSVVPVHHIDPWPRRAFPLQEEEYTRMQSESSSSSSNCEPLHKEVDRPVTREPSGRVYVDGSIGGVNGRSSSVDIPDADGCTSTVSSRQGSRAPSPHFSLESMSSVGDDPSDPDWMSSSVDNSIKATSNTTASRQRRASQPNPNIADPDWTMSSDNPRKAVSHITSIVLEET